MITSQWQMSHYTPQGRTMWADLIVILGPSNEEHFFLPQSRRLRSE